MDDKIIFLTENAIKLACSMMESPKMLETLNTVAKEKESTLLDVIAVNAVSLTGKIMYKIMSRLADCDNEQDDIGNPTESE